MSDTSRSVATPLQQNWRSQEWRDLICPICHRTTFGPEGSTYCGWHAESIGDVLMEARSR